MVHGTVERWDGPQSAEKLDLRLYRVDTTPPTTREVNGDTRRSGADRPLEWIEADIMSFSSESHPSNRMGLQVRLPMIGLSFVGLASESKPKNIRRSFLSKPHCGGGGRIIVLHRGSSEDVRALAASFRREGEQVRGKRTIKKDAGTNSR